jgi:hypothetical protein
MRRLQLAYLLDSARAGTHYKSIGLMLLYLHNFYEEILDNIDSFK